MNDIIENPPLREVLSEVKVPAATLVANPSRFTNIYERRVENILLDEETIPSQVATIRLARGRTKSLFDYTNDPKEAREGSFAATVRTGLERLVSGSTLTMGNNIIYDARRVYNGNVAHILGHHFAKLGYAKEKIGIEPGGCIVILEKNTPKVSHRMFEWVGYETYETNRNVEGVVLDVDVKRYDPYQIAPYIASIEPSGIEESGVEKLFISRKSSRKLTNEGEIVSMVENRGYFVCYFEDIPIAKQWSLVRDASSIISIHGAALGFLGSKGFPRPECEMRYNLIEIFSPGLMADIFRKTSAVLGGMWIGCRGRVSSYFVKRVDESTDFRSQEAKNFFLHPATLEAALERLDDSTLKRRMYK